MRFDGRASVPERLLATELARALDGEPAVADEAERLVSLLRTAAATYRFQVTDQERERAAARLGDAAPAVRRLRGPALAAAAIFAVVVALVLVPHGRGPGVDVQARASVAIRQVGVLHRLVTTLRDPRGGPVLERVQWNGTDGRTRVRVVVAGTVVDDVLREPGGRVIEYQGRTRRVVVAPSCQSGAGLCSELIDPIAFYRDRLLSGDATNVEHIRYAGRAAYRFILPAQRLGSGTTRISQIVTVDAAGFLPRRIVWVEQRPGGQAEASAVIEVRSIIPLSQDPPAVMMLRAPPGTPILQVDGIGRALGRPSIRPVSIAQAAATAPHAVWLGRSFHGLRLTGVRKYTWPGTGRVIRFDYGPLKLWDFWRVIPPSLVDGEVLPGKELATSGSAVRFYVASSGRLVAERDLPHVSVAVVAPELRKLDLFQAVAEVRPLR
jgi:hypothetical protein